MTNDIDDDSVTRALRRGLSIGPARADAAALPLEGAQALALAGYLDGSLTPAERSAVEAELLLAGGHLELLLASRDALAADPAGPLPSAAVLQRAQALIPNIRPAARRRGVAGWLRDSFARPLRPALGAAALALYGLFCLQVFDWGLAGGEILTAATATAADTASAETVFALALDDLM